MVGSLHFHLSCPRLKAGFFAISAVLQMLCDTCPVLGTFFKGIVVQKAQNFTFSGDFQERQVFNHMLFLVMFHIDPSLFALSKLLSHLTIASALYVRNVSVPMLSLYLLFLPPLCPCRSVGRVGQHVCPWSSVDISVRRPVQLTLVLLAFTTPSHETVTSGQEWHSVPRTPILLCTAWLFNLSLGHRFEETPGALRVSGKLSSGVSI